MLRIKLNIAKPLKVILIATLVFLHVFGSLIFVFNSLNRFYKSNISEQVIKSNINDSQSETAFTKKDNKDFQTFLPDLEKQKSKSYLKHHSVHDFNSLLTTYLNETNKYYYQQVDNKSIHPRSPPNYQS